MVVILVAANAYADTSVSKADSVQGIQIAAGNGASLTGVLAKLHGRSGKGGSKEAEAPLPPTFANVKYGPRERNVLDFWKAESDSPTPLVVYIHGGGFVAGDKSELYERGNSKIRKCLENKVSVATINYPFVMTDNLLDILHDTGRAIQFLRYKSAEWNIDKTRVASFGTSAGAGASLWLAFHDDLADASNPDPVLHESTRLAVAGANAPQATYDFSIWPNYLVLPPWLWDTSSGIVCPMYYHIEKEKMGTADGERMRKDLEILSFIDKSDPPVHLRTNRDNEPAKTWDHMLHHPGHAIKLRDTCQERGVDCVLIEKSTPQESRVDVLDFLLKYLGVTPKAAS